MVQEFTHDDAAGIGQTADVDGVQGSRQFAPDIFFGLAVEEFATSIWKRGHLKIYLGATPGAGKTAALPLADQLVGLAQHRERLLYMELASRRVIRIAVTDRPDAAWVTQQAQNLVFELEEHGLQVRFLIHDHDNKFGGGSDLVFQGESIEVIRTPIAAPKANSHMERQIGSTRRECLDWLLVVNRTHLERVLGEWIEHYNRARPHRGIGLRTPIARSDPVLASGPVRCRSRLGGLLREYEREPLPVAA